MSYHALLSPSSSARWSTCTASPGAQVGLVNKNSAASRHGTMCHQVLAEVLSAYIARYGHSRDPFDAAPLLVDTAHDYVGRFLAFWKSKSDKSKGETWRDAPNVNWDNLDVEASLEFTIEDAELVRSVVEFVVEQHRLFGGILRVEQRVPIDHITGERGASGSADIVIIGDGWVHVIDAKFGRKLVTARHVIAHESVDFITGKIIPAVTRPNLQMTMYASGALHKFGKAHAVAEIKLTIAQPTLHNFDTTAVSIAEFTATCQHLSAQAENTRSNPTFVPSTDACMYCLRSGNCKAETELALTTAFEAIDTSGNATLSAINDLTVGDHYAMLPFVEQWVKAVKTHVQTQLEDGQQVLRSNGHGYKLVAGRAGARQWVDDYEAETYLKKLRLNSSELYARKLISPAQFDRLIALAESQPDQGHTTLGPRQIARVRSLMVQPVGKPQIVPTTSSKPALVKASGFEDVPSEADGIAALFGLE